MEINKSEKAKIKKEKNQPQIVDMKKLKKTGKCKKNIYECKKKLKIREKTYK